MGRKGVIKLIWISLAVHVLYFVLLIFLVVYQKQIRALLSPDIEYNRFFSPIIIVGDTVFLVAHIVAAVKLVKGLSGEEASISRELISAILFGGGITWMNEIGKRFIAWQVNFHGSMEVASYWVFRRAASMIDPIRTVAGSLLLLGIGMSIYHKSAYRWDTSENQKKIVGLLWGSLGLDVIFYILMIGIIILQNRLKRFFYYTSLEFILPVRFIVIFTLLLTLHLILTIAMSRQLKRGGRMIECEILGFVAYGGMLGWLDLYLVRISAILAARAGMEILSNISIVEQMISICSPIRAIGISLFIICCGMTICRKKSGC